MSKYDTSLDLSKRNESHTLVTEMVGNDRAVLDVGCATGYLAEALQAQGCVVDGIEYDESAAEKARPHLDRLVVGDLERLPLTEAFPDRTYDRIVLADVLEHIKNPVEVLRSARELLNPDGQIVVSIPHVGHGSLRLALLQGRWRYTPLGLLDETHIRFYTLESIVDLLADAGFGVVEIYATLADPIRTEVEIDVADLPEHAVHWVREQPTALHYQYVLRAEPSASPDRTLPEVLTAVPPQSIVIDEHSVDPKAAHDALLVDHAATTDRLVDAIAQIDALEAQVADLRHAQLVQRDHVVGLEATLARTQRETAAAQCDVASATNEIATAKHEVAELQRQRDLIYGTYTWRLGRVAMLPVRAVRLVRRLAR